MSQNSADSIILSPRQVATGDPAGNALENINTNVLGDGALCYVETGVGQGEWQLQKTSTLPAGLNVVVPTAGPGRWLLMSSGASPIPVPSTEIEEIWVDGTNGTANGSGTEEDPFLTLSQAALRIGTQVWRPIALHLINSPVGGFILDELAGFRIINAPIVIIGEDGWEELAPPVLIDSMVGTLVTCTLAAPGWAVDAWANAYKAEILNPDGSSFGFYTVCANTAATLDVACPKTSAPLAGSSVRIVRPLTEILVGPLATFDKFIFGGASSESLVQATTRNTFVAPSNSAIHWVNVRLVGSGFPELNFAGQHNLVGSIFVCSDTTQPSFQVAGFVTSGLQSDTRLVAFGFPLDYSAGNGFAVGANAASSRYGVTQIFSSGQFVGSLVCGSIYARYQNGLAVFNWGWRLRAPSTSAARPIDCKYDANIVLSTVLITGGESYAALGATGSTGTFYAAEVERGGVTIFGTVRLLTNAHTLRAIDGSMVSFVTATFVPANVNGQIRAETSAIIKLSGRDYAELGPAIIGAVTPLTRAKAAWNVGDSVITQITLLSQIPRDGMPAIFRSA